MEKANLFARSADRAAGLKAGRLAGLSDKKTEGADLHVHTNHSDSSFSPAEVVELANKIGLKCVAITDHDSVSGVPEAIEAAKGSPLEVVAGVEISTRVDQGEIHIVGLFVDLNRGTLSEFLGRRFDERIARMHEMTAKLRAMGVTLHPEDVYAVAGKGSPGRTHVAEALVRTGRVGSMHEAFQRFIGDEGPAFIAREVVSPAEAAAHIRSSGGVPILAHPGLSNCDELIPMLVESGIMGIEVYYPSQSRANEQFYLRIAEKHGLLVSGGSDCHGKLKNVVMLGKIRLPEDIVQRLRDAAKR